MDYKKYVLTAEEEEEVSRLTDDEQSLGGHGWDWQDNRSCGASYAINVFDHDVITNWTEQKLDTKLSQVLGKTAFNIVQKIPFDIKKELFLEYKGEHHGSRPLANQPHEKSFITLYGISNDLLVHKLTIIEAKKLFQLSLDVKNGIFKLEKELETNLTYNSKSSFINFIG